jgi:signal transduction histidine kinase
VIGWLLIAALVLGGLGWVTSAALQLEQEQLLQRAQAEQDALIHLALWRLDSRISPLLAREESRPYSHYSAIHAVPLAFTNEGKAYPQGNVLELSPLLTSKLPEWMLLHFQADPAAWHSPQVLGTPLRKRLQQPARGPALVNATPQRQQQLARLQSDLPSQSLLASARAHARPAAQQDTAFVLTRPGQSDQQQLSNFFPQNQVAQTVQQPEYPIRQEQKRQNEVDNLGTNSITVDRHLAEMNLRANGSEWLFNRQAGLQERTEVQVELTSLTPVWVDVGGRDELVLLRLVRIGPTERCQGILLDAEALEQMLAREVADLFPQARLLPMREETPSQPERTMTVLPLLLDPGPLEADLEAGWTPLRVGLALAWLAAVVALLAVGLGGWSLLALSERRMRFVWAVTHELRTPLTTLRLYLDMLQSGMVREEKQRGEYIATLNSEANRLHNLIRNVLAFARLERQRPTCTRGRAGAEELLQQVRTAWEGRCQEAGKELVLDNRLPPGTLLCTDSEMVQQVLGNLIDNACKYSRSATDPRLWVRLGSEGGRLIFEVEDCGPGIRSNERRAIFRVFRRGRDADETAGGVGLGLALARRWARLLGGRLTLQPRASGACFRLDLPAS